MTAPCAGCTFFTGLSSRPIERSYRHEQRPWEPTCPAEMLDINLFRTDKGGDPVSLDPRPRHATDRATTLRSRKMAADTRSDRRE